MKFQWFMLVLAVLLCIWIVHEYIQNDITQTFKGLQIEAPQEGTPERTQTSNVSDKKIQYGNRDIKGSLPKDFNTDKIRFENEVNELWPELLKKNLTTQIEGSKIKLKKVTPQESFIRYQNGVGRFVESVLIELENDEGLPSSFRAEVDSATGMVLKTWDRPIFENFGDHHEKHLKIKPDGEIR